jgi:hypothetical protein
MDKYNIPGRLYLLFTGSYETSSRTLGIAHKILNYARKMPVFPWLLVAATDIQGLTLPPSP